MFLVGVLAFIVCMIIQYFSLHRAAWGRSMFIVVSMFLIGFMISLSPPKAVIVILSNVFYILAWGFMFFVTWYSIVRRLKMKKMTNSKS